MVHSTPLRVFMYGHWDDHAVDEIFLSLYKRGIHYTILTSGDLKEKMTWLDLTWTIMWLDLTWQKIAMTWLDSRLEYVWRDLTLWLKQGWLVTTLVFTIISILYFFRFLPYMPKVCFVYLLNGSLNLQCCYYHVGHCCIALQFSIMLYMYMYVCIYTVEPHYNEDLGTMKITLLMLYQISRYTSGWKNKEI